MSASDRAAAALALQQLEALLGRKEVSAAALGQAARSLKTDVGRELHFSEKQVREVGVQVGWIRVGWVEETARHTIHAASRGAGPFAGWGNVVGL